MATAFIRTIIVYILLELAMRLMGKRQIGELELSDFITTLLISELASLPITDSNIPFSRAIIPIMTLLIIEVLSSALFSRFPKLKNLMTARPTTLIKDGNICQKNLSLVRVSSDELISELRQNGISDISEVMYAILEQSGKVSVIPRVEHTPVTTHLLKSNAKESGMFHIVIDKGVLNRHSLDELGITETQVEDILAKKGRRIKDVYLMMINDDLESRTIMKERSSGRRRG